VGASNLAAVTRKLRGLDAIVLPYVAPMAVRLGGQPARLVGLSLDAAQARRLGVESPPWGKLSLQELGYERLGRIQPPAGQAAPASGSLEAVVPGVAGLRFPLRVAGASPGELALVPAELMGVLRTAQGRAVAFDGVGFSIARDGYRGFRLYARTIDVVPALAAALGAEGIEVIARVDDIQRIQVLDRGLQRLFWLVASLGIGGGAAVLVASLYAAVERKRRELAVLRLVGLTRGDVFFFPLSQGLGLALLGMLLSVLASGGLAAVINGAFAAELALGQRICALPPEALGMAGVGLASIATASSLLAAWRATRIDPAEAIREE
jgi:putative ABC transport system permease protein